MFDDDILEIQMVSNMAHSSDAFCNCISRKHARSSHIYIYLLTHIWNRKIDNLIDELTNENHIHYCDFQFESQLFRCIWNVKCVTTSRSISHLFINFGNNRCNLIKLMYIIDCVNARYYIEREIKSHVISITDVQIQYTRQLTNPNICIEWFISISQQVDD